MRNTIGCLTKNIKKSCKLYMTERELPPTKNEYFDSDSEFDFNDPNYFPIEELQDQVQQILIDYREYISMFTERQGRPLNTRFRTYDGFQSKGSFKQKSKLSIDSRIGYRRTSSKKMSICSGSFGNNKASYIYSQDEMRNNDDPNLGSAGIKVRDTENAIGGDDEDDKARWVPNDAHEG